MDIDRYYEVQRALAHSSQRKALTDEAVALVNRYDMAIRTYGKPSAITSKLSGYPSYTKSKGDRAEINDWVKDNRAVLADLWPLDMTLWLCLFIQALELHNYPDSLHNLGIAVLRRIEDIVPSGLHLMVVCEHVWRFHLEQRSRERLHLTV